MKLSKQHGFTLIEMMVALMIASIFFSILAGVVLATFETLRSGDERTVAQQNARVCLNYIANDIRHATEIAPLRFEAYRDWATGGLPVDPDVADPFFDGLRDAWPIYRRSVDSDLDGYIDLDIDGGSGDGDEYDDFRDDGYPYDVRPLAPNRLSLLTSGSLYYPNTQYYDLLVPVDIDFRGTREENPTAAATRVTYEHQLVKPLHPEVYDELTFGGRTKTFDMVVNRSDVEGVQDTVDFVVVRSFETRNPTVSKPDTGETSLPAEGPLGGIDSQIREDEPRLRQPVADHVVNLRFRYWHINGNRMIEIRYDPDEENISAGSGIDTDDGYYRYFDIAGHEIYVWYNHDTGEDVPLVPTGCSCGDPEYDDVDPYEFYIDGGQDGDERDEQGILLFEGWRFVNAISVTVKTANNRTLDIYRSSINLAITNELQADYGMGFIDFGLGVTAQDMTGTVNAFQPLYQGADNLRVSSSTVNGVDVFDFVEPNMNPNYDPNAFTTLQILVAPPAFQKKADEALRDLTRGLSYNCPTGQSYEI